MKEQSSQPCRVCQRRTLHARGKFSDGMGCLLVVLTGGIFIPVWLAISISDSSRTWRCQVCGTECRTAGVQCARAVYAIICLLLIAAIAAGFWYVYSDNPEWLKPLLNRP